MSSSHEWEAADPVCLDCVNVKDRVAKLEASVREAHRALAASYGNAGHAFNVLGAALAKTPMASVCTDSGQGDGHGESRKRDASSPAIGTSASRSDVASGVGSPAPEARVQRPSDARTYLTPVGNKCVKHNTFPDHDEPCWGCEREAMEQRTKEARNAIPCTCPNPALHERECPYLLACAPYGRCDRCTKALTLPPSMPGGGAAICGDCWRAAQRTNEALQGCATCPAHACMHLIENHPRTDSPLVEVPSDWVRRANDYLEELGVYLSPLVIEELVRRIRAEKQ